MEQGERARERWDHHNRRWACPCQAYTAYVRYGNSAMKPMQKLKHMKTRWQTEPAIFIASICQNAVYFSSVCKPSRLQRQKTKQQMEKEASIALMPLMGVGRTVDHHLRLISTEREWGKWTKNAIIQRGLNERVRVPKNAFHCWLACTVLSLCSAAWEDEIFPGPLRESLLLLSSKRTFKRQTQNPER